MFLKLILFGFLASAKAAEKSEIAISNGDDVSFTCESDSVAVWSKEDKQKDTILASGTSILPNWDSSRYSFTQKGQNYKMLISGANSDDAGVFICNNNFHFSLVVIGAPECGPEMASVVEDRHFDFHCAASVFGSPAPDAEATSGWTLGADQLQAQSKNAENKIESSISYTAKYLDHEKELKCEIDHPNWDSKRPKPFCSFGKLNVQFAPKITCPSNLLFKPEDKEYLIKCRIIGNPLPSVSTIKWEFRQKDERLKVPSFQTKSDSIDATLKLTNHHLSVRKSNRVVTLKVPNALIAGKDSFVSKKIHVGLIHGPVVTCPETIKVQPKDKGIAKVECRIHVNPVPPNSNISWYVDDDFIQRQRQDMIEKIPGGIVAKFDVQTENYGRDVLRAILKISGYQTVASDKVEILVSEMQKDEKVFRGKNEEKGGSFVNGNNGLLLLGGGTFFLMVLTVVVAIAFWKKGFFSSNESQYGARAVIAQGTMADSDFFGIADKGYDTGTFQFYQPKNALDPHGTMTMKLMKRIKESERDSEWTEGFAKMANALYLKDTDQDGYLTVMEAKPVILSYSDIYHLGITETKLDEVFTQCSNGQHVDVETLLRMISLPGV